MCSLCCSNINIWTPTADLQSFQHPVIELHLKKNCVPTTSIQGEIKKTHISLTHLASFQDLTLICVVCAVQISTYGMDPYSRSAFFPTSCHRNAFDKKLRIGTHAFCVLTTSIQVEIKFDLASFQGRTSISPSSAPDYGDFLPSSDFQPLSAMF